MEALQEASAAAEKKMQQLCELQDWLVKAYAEIRDQPQSDERWTLYLRYKGIAERVEKEIEELELKQEAALTKHLETTGPLTLEFEDGTQRVLAATPDTAGGKADLLPRDILSVWRVARVFQGSVALGGERTPLRFGDKAQVATVKLEKRQKKAKKDAVVGEETSLFGRE